MSSYGMYPTNYDDVRRWKAEKENADARLELAITKHCIDLLISQYNPVEMLGIDRNKLNVLLSFLKHHDADRLCRECTSLMPKESL